MKLRKIASFAIGAAMAVSMAGCGSSSSSEAESKDNASTDKTYKIGICQLIQHEALDAATKGFRDALTEKLGDKVVFDEQNAQGDSPTCGTIVNGFVSGKVDLILANATAPLQAAAAATDTIPVLGTSITDYATALEISDWTGTVGNNISGTSDLAPLEDQAKMIKELFPDAKNVGLLYCSGEPNSKYQVDVMKGYLEKDGYTVNYYSFVDSNDIASACTSACEKSDVLYIPTDNSAAAATETINNICEPAKVPVVAGEEGICKGCGVATLSISYYDLGYTTGQMAYDILVNGADVSKMAVKYAPNVTKKYNKELCDSLGIKIPEGYEEIQK